MISQLMESDILFFSESGVLDNAQWYKSGSFHITPAAQRITISGVAQHQEANQEYQQRNWKRFHPDGKEGVVTNNQELGRIWIINMGKLLFQEWVFECTDSWRNPVTLEQLKNQFFPAPSHSSAFQSPWELKPSEGKQRNPRASPHSLAPDTGSEHGRVGAEAGAAPELSPLLHSCR